MGRFPGRLGRAIGLAGGLTAAGYVGLSTGALTVDLDVGRRTRPLGPLTVDIGAARAEVFDILARPYLSQHPTPAGRDRLRVLERGGDMVLARHDAPMWAGLVTRTVELLRFTAPDRVDVRLLRGPVPHVVEEFVLSDHGLTTRVEYAGELATDLWAVGALWGAVVARRRENAVAQALVAVKAEAERTTGGPRPD
ncbi:MAG: hypothetical protein FWJ93_07730 [Micromonosporaceae bacterium]